MTKDKRVSKWSQRKERKKLEKMAATQTGKEIKVLAVSRWLKQKSPIKPRKRGNRNIARTSKLAKI